MYYLYYLYYMIYMMYFLYEVYVDMISISLLSPRLTFREVGLSSGELSLLLAAAEAQLQRGEIATAQLLATEAQRTAQREKLEEKAAQRRDAKM